MEALIWFNILFIVNAHGALQRIDPLVLINQGLIKGIKANDGDYSKFFGIPYAKVDSSNPFGTAREAPKFEEEVFNANDNSRKCPQRPVGIGVSSTHVESIDCLQLNVFVPNKASVHNPHPVMVWVHGGGFGVGSGNEYEAPNLVNQGVVVVTVNYRLGPYGFMCLDDPAVPGNQGLKDVHQALVWVRNNIAAFGGDPYNVTLAGQSAGSAIVLLQLYSTKEKLYDKVIAQSGTPLSPEFFTKGDSEAAVKLANHLGLNTTNNQQALEFLAQTHHSLVTGASQDLNMFFTPCTEKSFSGVDNFIDREPYALSNERKIRNTPILIGNTNEEYLSTAMHSITALHGDDILSKDFFNKILSEKFNLEKEEQEKIANILRHFYIGDKPISKDVEKEAENFFSDFVFNHPIEDTIKSLIRHNANPIYQYVFTYVGNSGAVGAAHGDDMLYLFNMTTDKALAENREVDSIMVDRMTTFWANFIKYGKPNRESSDSFPAQWLPVTETTRPYLNIGFELRMEQRFLKERNAFWDLFQSVYGNYSKLAL